MYETRSEFVRYVDAPAANRVGANKSGSLGLWTFAFSHDGKNCRGMK